MAPVEARRIDGLFEVVEGIYQVRGMDLSNTTLVEGDEGVIVFDTLLSVETGAAALALYRKHRGDRPVKAVVITHSHADHFGGIKGFVTQEEVDAGQVPGLRPRGVHRARGLGERLRRHRDEPPGRLHVRRVRWPAVRRAGSGPASARRSRPGPSR